MAAGEKHRADHQSRRHAVDVKIVKLDSRADKTGEGDAGNGRDGGGFGHSGLLVMIDDNKVF